MDPLTPLLLSLKPQYSDLVFTGMKRVELRRRAPNSTTGADAFVYATSPAMELRGGFRVGEVWTGTPGEIWDAVCNDVGVDKRAYDAYYADRGVAYALEITDVWQYANPVGLTKLREMFQNFVVPQSWRYVRPEEQQSFESMERK